MHGGHPSKHYPASVLLSFQEETSLGTFLFMLASVTNGLHLQMNMAGIPPGTGPYPVGCTDVMTPHGVQGSFMRVYYPARDAVVKQPKVNPQPLWIPRREYTGGLVNFLNLNPCFTSFFTFMFASYHVPVEWNAPFRSGEKFPLIIFSHGLGAFRTLYSTVCVEMASRGFIVGAVEHRDLSSSATYFIRPKEGEGGTAAEAAACDGEEKAALHNGECMQEVWLPYRKLLPGEKEFPLRNQQVHQRADECVRGLRLLEDINEGRPIQNVLPSGFDFQQLKGSMDLEKLSVMGHSFGGATAIVSLTKEPRFRCAVVMDSWMLPIERDLYPNVTQPIFFINTEKFQWVANIQSQRQLDSSTVDRRMITILGTVHQSQADFTFVTGSFLGKLAKTRGTLDPLTAIHINNRASLAFLQKHLELDKDFSQWDSLLDGKGEHVIRGTNVVMPSVPPSQL
uniref:Platelet-activating factor acetylhydrolase n=2 Tax=Petromyzon marinus TaxID=7757 RepID=A0AAJ7WUQ0_PETMA|nr:platelet-activating factor acetylhydrolase 2, cytoplasmic isoform X2 [Petromyzon marinus]